MTPAQLHKENDLMRRMVAVMVVLGLSAGLGAAGEVKFALTGDNTKVTFVGKDHIEGFRG